MKFEWEAFFLWVYSTFMVYKLLHLMNEQQPTKKLTHKWEKAIQACLYFHIRPFSDVHYT